MLCNGVSAHHLAESLLPFENLLGVHLGVGAHQRHQPHLNWEWVNWHLEGIMGYCRIGVISHIKLGNGQIAYISTIMLTGIIARTWIG